MSIERGVGERKHGPLRGSVRAYARWRTERGEPTSHTAVNKAIKAGRLSPPGPDGLDFLQADAEWAENTKHHYRGPGPEETQRAEPQSAEPAQPTPEPAKPAPVASTQPVQPAIPVAAPIQGLPTRQESERIERWYKAQQQRMEAEERAGELLEVPRLKLKLSQLAGVVISNLGGMPNRLAAELAIQSDPAAVRRRLQTEVDAIIAELRDPERMFAA